MAALILLFWFVLNGRVTWEIAGLGAVIAALGLFFMCKACDWSLKKEMGLYRAAPLIGAYACTVIWEIAKANWAMLPVIYGGKPEPVVRVIKTKLKSRWGKMALSNSITLTPGTITLAVHHNELTVHCLTPRLAEGLEGLIFEKKLEKIEEALHG